MSIDRGKLLTEIEHEITAMATKVDVTVRLGRASNIMAKVRAIAQPAEAVDGELLNDLEAEALLAWPRGVEQRFVGAREQRIAKLCKRAIAALAHDAAQGAVATVCLVGERYAHGHMVSVELQLAGENAPAPKIGDRYYTNPQAAPAQGGGDEWGSRMRRLARVGPFTAQPGERYIDEDVAVIVLRRALAAAPSQEPQND